ncbi:MAG: division/cell wall cluster transcriptional repressor MraZ [Pirellulales bacterium]|nr:division/cell wall cluster transcriptional repressor MraZ [Pirellulales bacterium]
MASANDFILGEFPRKLDERFRLSIPSELLDELVKDGSDCILVKERPGCLSLWAATDWRTRLEQGVELVKSRMHARRLDGQLGDVQQFGRLLSTRHREVQLAGRGRLSIPEGFREFLRAEPGEEVILVGAAICIEIWNPPDWMQHLDASIPGFTQLFDNLAS